MVNLREYAKLFRHVLFRARKVRMLEPGSPAPSFSVSDESGQVRTLDEFSGKTLVLWFYPRADTPG